MIDSSLIGSRIKELRQKRGLTQSEFADILSVSFQAVSNWERGISPPDIENLLQIASYFDILVDTLLSPMGEDLYLGIDGGGTKTEFAVVSSAGKVFKRIIKPGSNPVDIGYANTEELICSEIKNILIEYPSIKGIFCGIAGIATGNNSVKLHTTLKKLYPHIEIEIASDALSLFALCDGVDMVVISGTGSVVFIKDGNDYKRLGGWGYLFKDVGSAFNIAKDAICSGLSEEDLLEKPSTLHKMLLKKMNTKTISEYFKDLYSGGKSFIAAFASVVFEAYKMGEETAVQIIDDNAKGLAELLNTGCKLYSTSPTAIASGGIFENYPEIMMKHIGKYSDVKILINQMPPIYGACRKACLLASCKMSDDFYENFEKTYGGLKI